MDLLSFYFLLISHLPMEEFYLSALDNKMPTHFPFEKLLLGIKFMWFFVGMTPLRLRDRYMTQSWSVKAYSHLATGIGSRICTPGGQWQPRNFDRNFEKESLSTEMLVGQNASLEL